MPLCVLGTFDGMMALTSELSYDQGISPHEKRNVCTHLGIWIVVILSSQEVPIDTPS